MSPLKPFVNVLMPQYNVEPYLVESIESILQQTYPHFRFFILDDCSTDDSYNIAKRYAAQDERIILLRNGENLGITASRNVLLRAIDNDYPYFAWHDSDDISLPSRLEKQVHFLEQHSEYVGCGSAIEYFFPDGKTIERFYESDAQKVRSIGMVTSPMAQGATMLRSSVVKDIGLQNEEFAVAADWEYWMRILKKHQLTNLPEVLIRYRQHEGQAKASKLKRTLKNSLKIKMANVSLKDLYSPTIIFRFIAECVLLVMPNSLVLWLFYKIIK